MNKKEVNVRRLVDKYQENCDRINQIADLCEKEERERTDAETKEYEALVRENQLLGMKMQAATAEHLRENPNAKQDAEKIIRENANKGMKTEIIFVRDMMLVSDLASSATIPLNVQDFIKPLTEGFILDKVGLPLPTGLAGDYVWPTYEMIEATVLGEGVALTDTKIHFSKLTANPARIGAAVSMSNQSLTQTEGLLETVVRDIMPKAIRILLNKVVFGLSAVNTPAQTAGLVGPFVALKASAKTLSAVPTFKELNGMKAKVLETGVDGDHMCWTMTKSMCAILEGTPINEKGIYVPMIQDGKLCGLPVYTTNVMRETVPGEEDATITTEYIGLGDWRYQPMGLFGSLRFIVDPYSQARKDAVDFVLNCDYGTKTLRPEAFLLGKVANA